MKALLKILIIGSNGQIGWELMRSLSTIGVIIPTTRDNLNLLDTAIIRSTIHKVKPHIIINAAAYTNVEQAEDEPELAKKINAIAPEVMAQAAYEIGAWLIHYSTDYVFSGQSSAPYTEIDQPNPKNVYGHSKLLGETKIRASLCKHLILRTGWVYGLHGKNFLNSIIKKATEHTEIHVVNNQYGSPTWSRNIADATAQIIAQSQLQGMATTGTYHITSSGTASWHQFAKLIIQKYSTFLPLQCKTVKEISSQLYPTKAKRPKNSVLNTNKLRKKLHITLPNWEFALALCLIDMKQRHRSLEQPTKTNG